MKTCSGILIAVTLTVKNYICSLVSGVSVATVVIETETDCSSGIEEAAALARLAEGMPVDCAASTCDLSTWFICHCSRCVQHTWRVEMAEAYVSGI